MVRKKDVSIHKMNGNEDLRKKRKRSRYWTAGPGCHTVTRRPWDEDIPLKRPTGVSSSETAGECQIVGPSNHPKREDTK